MSGLTVTVEAETKGRSRSPSPQRDETLRYSPGRNKYFSPLSPKRSPDMRKNDYGGVFISRHEIEHAFQFLDTKKKGRISFSMLKKRLGEFFPEMLSKDFKLMMKDKHDISLDELIDLLMDNDLNQYDPVYEAFRAYDPQNHGYITKESMVKVFDVLGMGQLHGNDMDILFCTADLDNDGRITLVDFRNMLNNFANDSIVTAGSTDFQDSSSLAGPAT